MQQQLEAQQMQAHQAIQHAQMLQAEAERSRQAELRAEAAATAQMEAAKQASLEQVSATAARAQAETEVELAKAMAESEALASAAAEAVARTAVEVSRAQAEADAAARARAEVDVMQQKVRQYEERCDALGRLLRTKNEIVWTLMQQQQELTADNGTHKTNFEVFNKQVPRPARPAPAPRPPCDRCCLTVSTARCRRKRNSRAGSR
jgi:hypothetical protein